MSFFIQKRNSLKAGLLFMVVSVLTSCSHISHEIDGLSYAEISSRIFSQREKRVAEFTAIQGLAKLRSSRNGEHSPTLDLSILANRSGQLRIEATGPLGELYYLLLLDQGRVALYEDKSQKLFLGPWENLKDLNLDFPLALKEETLIAALFGEIPAEFYRGELVDQQTQKGWKSGFQCNIHQSLGEVSVLTWRAPEGKSSKILFDQDLRFSWGVQSGGLEICYGDWDASNELPSFYLPGIVQILYSGKDEKESRGLHLVWRDKKRQASLPRRLFSWKTQMKRLPIRKIIRF